MKLTNLKVMITQYLLTFSEVDLQLVYVDLLRLVDKQILPYQKTLEFCLTVSKTDN